MNQFFKEDGVWIHGEEMFFRRLNDPEQAKKWLETLQERGEIELTPPEGKQITDLTGKDYVMLAKDVFNHMCKDVAVQKGELH